MAKVKLNINRTQIIDVPVPVGDSFETFKVEMKILKNDAEDGFKLIDLIVDVQDLEMADESGRLLTKEAMIEAIKNDSELSRLIINAWTLGNQKIVTKQKTLLEQPKP